MRTKSEIFQDHKKAQIIESKKTVLKLDILMSLVVLAGIIVTTLIF